MKRLLFILLFLLAAIGLSAHETAQAAAPVGEFRGVWIHLPTGMGDWGWDKSIRVLSEQGFNAIFVNLAWAGCSDYPSRVLTPHPMLRQKDGSCRDLLQECLDACRKYGVQLHVWIVACNAGEHTPEVVRKKFREAGRLQESVDGEDDKCYIAPQHPANVRMLADTVTEILANYDVDGIHLDYIRYPLGQYDYSKRARRDFQRAIGRRVDHWPQDCQKGGPLWERFSQWRRDNITNLVRRVRHAIRRSRRPKTPLSVAVYGLWAGARVSVAQDAAAWIDEGLVDFVCPMNYSADAMDADYWLRLQVRDIAGRVPIYTGLAAYQCKDATALAGQIHDARRYGADGFILFQYRPPLSDKWLPELHKSAVPGWSAAPYAHQVKGVACQWRRCAARDSLVRPWYQMSGDVLECRVEIPERLMGAGRVKCTVMLDGRPWREPEISERNAPGQYVFAFTADDAGIYRLRLEWTGRDGRPCAWQSTTARVHLLPGDLVGFYLGKWFLPGQTLF